MDILTFVIDQFSNFIHLVFTYPKIMLPLIGAAWIVVYVAKRKNVAVQRFEVNTSQSRDELMNRAKSALDKHSGLPSTQRRTRGGFHLENDDTFVSGQRLKEKK